MDQKKRRNSILKKPPLTDEENTGEITTKIKRRISFSGKKSVKEFLAGEEQATIWGTSYEESAECLHANSTESAVVGVNDKRIVLRNRRVVVETNRSNKRRSKKKVHVAENDKENVFIQTPQVEIEAPSGPVPLETSNKADSPVKSELVLVTSNVLNVRTMMEQLDSMNACSNTFDFINNSGAINKTVTIEQSVDVSLDENELQMFKFRVPVSAMDVSRNLSLNRDGSSPNIFSSSILMSDDDMKMIKLIKAQMGGLISTGEPLRMIESAEKVALSEGNGTELVEVISNELPKENSQRKTITATEEMVMVCEVEEMGKSLETKNLKRKTITAATKMDETSLWPDSSGKCHATVMMDVHSPMRKKPMHKQLDKPMDISAIVIEEQKGPPKRQTIHFESAAIDESLHNEVVMSEESVCARQAGHFDQNQIHEDTICQENDDPSPVSEGNHMEISLVDVEIGVEARTTKKRQSIHGPVDILEEDPPSVNAAGRVEASMPCLQRKSICMPTDIVEDSPKPPKPSQSRRESVYTPTDIVEDSPKPTKDKELHNPKLKGRQTIYNADIVEEVSVQCMPSAVSGLSSAPSSGARACAPVRRTIVTAVDMVFDPQHEMKSSKDRKSVYTPSDMVEDELCGQGKGNDFKISQKSIYAPADMVEDSPKLSRTKENNAKPGFIRGEKSGYAPTETMDDSSMLTKTSTSNEKYAAQGIRVAAQDRKSIYTPSDIIEDSAKMQKTNENHKSLGRLGIVGRVQERKSIYTSTEMIEDSLKIGRTNEISGRTVRGVQERKSIYTAADMIEDSPQPSKPQENFQNNDAPRLTGRVHGSKSICNPLDMIEDSPKVSRPTEVPRQPEVQGLKGAASDRKSIYMSSDIVEESFNPSKAGKISSLKRQSIYTCVDMVEDSPKPLHKSKVLQRQMSVFEGFPDETLDKRNKGKPTDIRESSPVEEFESRDLRDQSKCNAEKESTKGATNFASRSQETSIYTPADMLEDSPPKLLTNRNPGLGEFKSRSLRGQSNCNAEKESTQTSMPRATSRHTIYAPADMLEDSPPKLSTARNLEIDEFKSRSLRDQSNCDAKKESTKIVPNSESNSQETSMPRATGLHTIYAPVEMLEDSPSKLSTTRTPGIELKNLRLQSNCNAERESTKSARNSASNSQETSTPRATSRHTIYAPADMLEDSPPKRCPARNSEIDEFKSRSLRDQSNCNVEMESTKIVKNSASLRAQETSMPRATSRQTIYASADMLEDSPPKLSTTRNPHDSHFATNSVYISGVSTNCPQSPQSKATSRKTICAPSDILDDSLSSKGRHSICTAADIIEDSPKMPEFNHPQPVASAPKVIVRHMTLQQGLMGDNAAMRILKNQQTKAKVPDPVQLNESAMDVSFGETAPLPTSRPNFSKLNEQMVRGEVKAFADEHKNKKSLFDRLETIAADGPQFDSFQKKPNAMTEYLMKPKKSSLNDYTLELTRNTFDGQRKQGNEYTMDFSSRMLSKTVHERTADRPHDVRNLEVQMSPIPSETVEVGRSASDSKRKTIHFQNENEMDVSTSVKSQDAPKCQTSRQTIHFHEHLELDKTNTQAYPNQARSVVFEKNPRTVHFKENNQMDETMHMSNAEVKQIAQDMSAAGVSIPNDGINNDVSFEPMKDDHVSRLVCQENLTRQSCIMRTSSLDAAPKSATQTLSAPNRQTICAPAYILEATRDQIIAQQDDTMDLSASICAQPSESKLIQPASESQLVSTSIGRQRRTIHCNDDLELDDTGAECPPIAHVGRKSQTACRPDPVPDIEKSAHERKKVSGIPTRIAGRKTIHFNQDLELDDDKTVKSIENPKQSANRQTIYFQQNVEMDESLMECPGDKKTADEFHGKEDVSKVLPKPRRMTTFDDVPVDVDESVEKTTTRKSNFSRTLNFDEIAKATSKSQSVEEKDSPLFDYNSKLKRYESTTDIDRSLAEYLKAEAAATLYRCSPNHMDVDVVEQSPQSEYFDAEDEQVERGQFIVGQREDHKRGHMLEESGMQPLQRTATRGDIEVCEPDGAKQEEPNLEPSDMSFELRGLQANRLNHEFFDKEVSVSPKPQQPQQKEDRAKVRRQTIREPEPMMEQSVMENMNLEESVETKEVISQPNRKTIHFTNENAVDESFFDENVSKPAAEKKNQNNRHTVYFNESQDSIDDMDTSLTQNISGTQTHTNSIGRSKAAQSMKEILRESNMLFTQSMLKPHLFETKQSTVCFDAKDISLDTVPVHDNAKQDENTQCTPTKANKSRIPQLIGSAKKLQSMKKSMEFIQQKLPNLATKDEDMVLRQVDKPADVPRGETSLSCQPERFEDPFEVVETTQEVVANELQESFETVEIPRRATTFQRNDTLYLCQNEVDITNISEKSNFRFEDVPITISDVSTYFAQKPPPTAKQTQVEAYCPNTTEALCNLDMNKFADETQLPKSSDSEDTACNFDKFKKRYVELTCESINLTSFNEDIEKTHLSLVNTLDEHESEVVRETCSELHQPEMGLPLETNNFSSSVCRKCKRHKQTVSQNDTTISSFVLAPLPEYKMDLAALSELRNKPRVLDVAKIWRQNLRESDSFNISEGKSAIDLEDAETMDNFIASLNSERRMAAQQRQRKEFKHEASFVHTVRKKLQSKKTNWILNDQLLTQNILKFTHTRIRTFAIFISFTQKDPRGVDVEFNEMRVVPNVLHSRVWTAFEYALHYQLLVELPFDLSTLCPKSENLFQLLEHVECVTQDVLKTGRDVLYLVLSSPASLIREPSGGIYIRKYTRTRTAQNEVKRTEFQIEVRNMKRLSYESITQPPLYEFDEKIQLLPTGQDFLRVFLADPLRYMKA